MLQPYRIQSTGPWPERPFPARSLLLACTNAVVVFSVLVQGLTVRRVLVHDGIGMKP